MTKFLAQSLAQNQATLKAIQGMKVSGKNDVEASFNWLLTHASVDLLALIRLLINELLPGVFVCSYVCNLCLSSGGGIQRHTRGRDWGRSRAPSRAAPAVQIFHLHPGCGNVTMSLPVQHPVVHLTS
jgi:hypothetical protein